MLEDSLSLAKITRPVYSGIFLRKRLFRLLDQNKEKPITWICGPPGSGKTVLVSSYIEFNSGRCVWYQLDKVDRDVNSFFYYMSLAVKKAKTYRKKSLPLLTPEYLSDIPTFTLRYFERLFSLLTPPACLVIDNYHEVSEDSLFHEIICDGLKIIPEGINVIIISRNEPPKRMTRFQLNSLMNIIKWDEIRLTMEESHGIIKIMLKGQQSKIKNELQTIFKWTDGWVAGLVLILEKLKRGEVDKDITTTKRISTETISDYLTTEVIQKMDYDTRVFMLKTAVLPSMSPKMAEMLTGINHADRILEDLYRNNFFTDKHIQTNPVYQYHPLFREYLFNLAIDHFSKDEFSYMQIKAGEILEESEKYDDAFEQFRNASYWEGITRLVLKHAQELLRQGRNRVLEIWLSNIPEEIICKNPWLLYWLGLSHLPLNPSKGIENLELAFNLFKKQWDVTGVYMSWSSIVQSITHITMNLKELDRWIRVFGGLAGDFGEPPSAEIAAIVTNNMFMALVYRQPDNPEIDLWAEKAHKLSREIRDHNMRVQALINLCYHNARCGDFEAAESIINSLQHLCKDKDITPSMYLLMKWMESTYLALTGSHEDCLNIVLEALNQANSTGTHIFDFMLMGHAALSALNIRDLPNADKFLKGMASYLENVRPVDQSFYHNLMAHKALLQGNFGKADSQTELMWEKGRNAGFQVIDFVYHYEKAHVMQGFKDYAKAQDNLNKGFEFARKMRSKPFEFMCLITEAQFAFDRDDHNKGVALLTSALVFGKKHGYFSAYIWDSRAMVRLCLKALEAGIETEYVQEIIKRRNLMPETPPVEIESWPWLMKIFTLGRFRVIIDGKAVQFNKKGQQKPIELLKALISLGGRDVSEEDLTDVLWPDSDGDTAHQNFATTLHRLRQLLGYEKLILLKDGRLTLNPSYCYVDAWAFERILGKIEKESRSGYTEDMIQMLDKALSMYQGHFLEGDADNAWTTSIRERLKNKLFRIIGNIGSYYEMAGQFEKTIYYFQKGLEVDDLAEVFYQHLITCYINMGYKAEAIKTYQRCKKVFSSVLGIPPSPQIEDIYHRMMNS